MEDTAKKQVDIFIPSERLSEFKRKVESLQGLARKLSLPEWDVSFQEKEWRPVRKVSEDHSGQPVLTMVKMEGTPVSIVGSAPVVAGWRFVAKIEHGEGGNIVKKMGGDSAPPEWHACGPHCSHCDVARQRNNTYMLMNMESGEIKQVGSSCVFDFLGGNLRDPERIAAMYDFLSTLEHEFIDDPDREISGGGAVQYGVEPVRLMAAVLKIVEEDGGYISVEKMETLQVLSTRDRLADAFWGHRPNVITPDQSHVAQAPKIVQWLSEQKSTESLWLRNIAYLSDRPAITAKDAGLFASGFVAWNRELHRSLTAEHGPGNWVGTPGEKITSSVTFERRGGFDTQYGFKSVLSFRDDKGDVLTWKTQSPPSGLVLGGSYHLQGTVKEHVDYKGIKQTELLRVKVAELELFNFGPLPGYKKVAAVARADVVDQSEHTPLLKATWVDAVDHAQVLLKFGADANALNQGKVPILAYATSVAMAKVLLENGARPGDLTPEYFDALVPDVKTFVQAALPVASIGPEMTCLDGVFSGPIVSVVDGVVEQGLGRGKSIAHDSARLTRVVEIGETATIKYLDGIGHVSDKEMAVQGATVGQGQGR